MKPYIEVVEILDSDSDSDSGLKSDSSEVLEQDKLENRDADDKQDDQQNGHEEIDMLHQEYVSNNEDLSQNSVDGDYGDSFESDDDEDDIRGDIRNEQIRKIERSRLSMTIQGFKQNTHSSLLRDDSGEENDKGFESFEPFDPAQIISQDKRVFKKNHCYYYRETESHNKLIVGILNFESNDIARCILIVKFEDTFLDEDDSDNEHQHRFVQVHKKINYIKISDLGEEHGDIKEIPKLIYDPQEVGNWCNFGYFFDRRNFKRTKRREEIRSLEFFSGAGGSLQGYHNNNIKCVMAIEKDHNAVCTLRANNEGLKVWEGCINDFLNNYDILKSALGTIDHIQFSPPCQGLSSANRNKTMTISDRANNELSLRIIDVIRKTSCETALYENVLGIWRGKNIQYLRKMVKGILQLNYQVRACTLKACDYGDPQKRPRFFLFVSKYSIPIPRLPSKSHGDGKGLEEFVTVKDALSPFHNVDKSSIPNMNIKTTTIRPGQHGLIRLNPNGLSPAIRTNSLSPFHYSEERCISVREAASLQSFPSHYKFYGNIDSQYRQVGNAVPIGLATAVAHSIKEVLTYEYEYE